jgi:hypothetical protein
MTGNSTSGSINMYNGNTTGGTVNIATGTGVTQSTVVNIGSGSTTGTVTIGGVSNTVQVNGALTMGTGRNITLQPTAGFVAPTGGTMLGGISTPTLSSTTATGGAAALTGAPTDLVTFTMPVGVFIFTANAQINTANVTYDWVFSPTSATVANAGGSYVNVAGGTQRTTFVISNTTSATWYWGARANVSSVDYAFMGITLTRIA